MDGCYNNLDRSKEFVNWKIYQKRNLHCNKRGKYMETKRDNIHKGQNKKA